MNDKRPPQNPTNLTNKDNRPNKPYSKNRPHHYNNKNNQNQRHQQKRNRPPTQEKDIYGNPILSKYQYNDRQLPQNNNYHPSSERSGQNVNNASGTHTSNNNRPTQRPPYRGGQHLSPKTQSPKEFAPRTDQQRSTSENYRNNPHRQKNDFRKPPGNQFNNNRRPSQQQPRTDYRPQTPQELLSQFLDLQKQHHLARKKYYEQYHRCDQANKSKLEREFYRACRTLRSFEDRLNPTQKKILAPFRGDYKLDTTYSNNHELPADVEKIEVKENEKFYDPHLTLLQQRRERYFEDKEETVGTLEDYKRLKGLV